MNKKRKISTLYQAAFIIGLTILMLLGTAKVRAASFTEITDSACLHAYPLSKKAFPIYSDHEMTAWQERVLIKNTRLSSFLEIPCSWFIRQKMEPEKRDMHLPAVFCSSHPVKEKECT